MTIEDRIKKGLEGKYQGLSNGFTSINEFLFGIQRATYYLLGGASGTFKTTLCDYMLLNAIQDAEAKGIKLTVFYYSFEIDELTKKCNWLSVLIYQKYGVMIPPERIKGLGNNRMTPDEQAMIKDELPIVNEMFKKINFRFISTNPTGVYHELWAHGVANGELLFESYTDLSGNPAKRAIGYKPNNDESYTIAVLDHLYLLKKEREFNTKEVIDKYSEYCVTMRNLFGFTFINVQQFNDGLSSIERQKYKGIDISPQMTDFRDTRSSYMDADVVLGTMCPFKMDLETCLSYNVKKLGSNMIMLKIIKNRLSKDNVGVGLYCNPKAGSFTELPGPLAMNDTVYESLKNGTYVRGG